MSNFELSIARSPDSDPEVSMETEPVSRKPRLVLIRRISPETTIGGAELIAPIFDDRALGSGVAHGRTLDLGFWLFRDILLRRNVWSRLIAPSALIPLLQEPTSRRFHAALKRTCDFVASTALLVLLTPLFLLVAALVRLDSPGPAIFRQRRVGKDGKEFMLWKFRSMRVEAPVYAPSPISTYDPRLTRVGRLIRRASIDELPQLLNVIRGEMSLVGPRPEMPFIVESYTALERKRLAVQPGITGLWQVSPARAFPIHENLQFDLHYIHHQNLILDASILLRTVVAIFRGIGAV